MRKLTEENPKPAIEVCGVPLILRNFFILKKLNVDVVVVVGYKAEHIKRLFRGESVEFVHNDDLDRGNAYSVLCAKNALRDEDAFIVLMGDHLFSEEFLNAVVKTAVAITAGNEKTAARDVTDPEDTPTTNATATTALKVSKASKASTASTAAATSTDASTSATVTATSSLVVIACARGVDFVDVEEATKIKAKGGVVEDIGKHLNDWTHIDTGAFICTPHIFETLERAFASKRKVEWSEIVKMERMKIHEVNAFWADIDTVEDLKNAENALLKQLIKEEDGIISKYINRKISLRISKWLCSYDIHPNFISFFSFILATIASFFFISHAFVFSYLIGGVMAQISSVIDGVDGEIARLKMKTTKFGGFYDAVLDRYADVLLLSSIFIATLSQAQAFFTPSSPFMLVTISAFIAALTGASLVSYTASKFSEVYGERVEKYEKKARLIPGKRDERIFIIFLCAVLAELNAIFLLLSLVILAISTNLRSLCRVFIAKNM